MLKKAVFGGALLASLLRCRAVRIESKELEGLEQLPGEDCDKYVGTTCQFVKCHESRHSTCEKGQCTCPKGHCAVRGRCVELVQEEAVEEADQGSVKAKKKQADCDNRAGFRQCKSWASAGYCKKRSYIYGKEYMGVNCRKQCGCRGPPPPKAAAIHWTSNYKQCFDVDGGTPRKGASIWLWACKRNGLNQLFTIPPDGQAGQIKWATFPQMCLDVDDSKDKIGANIRIWRCSRRRPNQKFIVPARGTAGPIRWANHTEYCLVDGVGGNIQMGKCDDEDFYKEFNWGNPSEDGAREITYRKDLAKKTGIRHKVLGASTSLSIEEFGGR